MANLRIINDNAVDRCTSITANTAAGLLTASNMLTDIKSQVWRATATSATLTVTWANLEPLSGVALPYTNLTAGATIRAYGYTNTGDSAPVFNTGAMLACPAGPVVPRSWNGLAVGANAYAYGGGACARVWFGVALVRKLVIEIIDVGNPAGYIEAAHLVAGRYWSPTYNHDYGATATPQDTGKNYRTDAGDLLTDVGTRNKKIALSLNNMTTADRNALFSILTSNGTTYPIFMSLYPGAADLTMERDHQVYGKATAVPTTTGASYNRYSAPIEIESC